MSPKSALRFVGIRILQSIPVLLSVIVINFILIRAAPGDPVTLIVGPGAVSEEFLDKVRHDLGLDLPIHEQLIIYLSQIVRGDLGTSYVQRLPVMHIIMSRLPATLLLMGTSFLIAAIMGILFGAIASKKPNSLKDSSIMVVALVGYSAPEFWTAFLLMLVFGLYLKWTPVSGMTDMRQSLEGLPLVLDIAHHMILPVTALAFFYSSLIARLTRSSMMEELQKDYIILARSKGISENRVTYRHALPNAVLPVIAVLGLQFGTMLGGAVLVEAVFAWPGMGRLLIDAAQLRDYPTLMGVLIFSTVFVVSANLIADLISFSVDPRLRVDGAKQK